MAGISNVTTEECFEEEDYDLKKNFVGVFSSDKTTPFLNFLTMMKKRRLLSICDIKYRQKQSTRYSLVEYIEYTSEKQLFLFDSYGFTGFKAFIKQEDSDIINKILYNTKKFNKDDTIVILITITFSKGNYERLTRDEILSLAQRPPISFI